MRYILATFMEVFQYVGRGIDYALTLALALYFQAAVIEVYVLSSEVKHFLQANACCGQYAEHGFNTAFCVSVCLAEVVHGDCIGYRLGKLLSILQLRGVLFDNSYPHEVTINAANGSYFPVCGAGLHALFAPIGDVVINIISGDCGPSGPGLTAQEPNAEIMDVAFVCPNGVVIIAFDMLGILNVLLYWCHDWISSWSVSTI